MAVRRDPLANLNPAATPQSRPIPGREADMAANNAGGYTFAKDTWNKLEDFVITGTSGGTYYVEERRHTLGNVAWVAEAVAADPLRAAQFAHGCLTGFPQRAPRPHGGLFVIAAAHAKGTPGARAWIEAHAHECMRTSYQRSLFWGYYRQQAGQPRKGGDREPTMPSGRAARRLFQSLFLGPDVHSLAVSVAKGRSRKTSAGEDVSAHDLLRKYHPKPDSPERDALFAWIGGKDNGRAAELLPVIAGFDAAQALESERVAAAFVRQNQRTPWEFIPSKLRTGQVWAELAGTVGMTALVRNLGLMTRNGALVPMGPVAAKVTERLGNEGAVRGSRMHPIDIWLAQQAYASGISRPHPSKPPETWQPVSTVLGALDRAWEAAIGGVTPGGKRILIAVDCSASMTAPVLLPSGSPIGSAYQVACVMALMIARTEPNVHVIEVDTSVHPSRLTPATGIAEIGGWQPHGGGTNLSLPFLWAARERVMADGVLVLTDNETWEGWSHPSEALEAYRRAVSPACKVIVASMTAAGHTIADPRDEGVLNIAGLDAALPQLVAGFIR